MKDLVDRLLRARNNPKQPEPVDEKIRTYRDVHLKASDRRVEGEDWDRRVIPVARNCVRRLWSLGDKGHESVIVATRWKGPSGRQRLFDYAIALAREEYREGFVFSGRLGSGQVHLVTEDTVTWFPASLARMLTKRCTNKKAALPYGVGVLGNGYFWRSLDGTNRTGNDPYYLHCGFIRERRDLMASWILRDIGPRTKRLLQEKIERIDRLLEAGEEVNHL